MKFPAEKKTRRDFLSMASSLPVALSVANTALGGELGASTSADTSTDAQNADTSWFTDARFGMFIHFGLYSIPAGVWNGQRMGRNWYAEWIRMQHDFPNKPVGISRKEYDTLLRQFNPQEFDADAWIAQAKQAGMKYFLITAKHHDGFALWPTEVSPYNVVDATPFGRDILGELKAACDKHGIRLGFYYSHWQDWGHAGGALPPWDGRSESNPDIITQPSPAAFAKYWETIALPQVRELIDNYNPAFFWFDTWYNVNKEQITESRIEELIQLVRSASPTCLINSRIGSTWCHPKGDALVDYLSMGDNSFPEKRIERPWETSGTMCRSWGYHKIDYQWKHTDAFLRHLIDNVSKGGNYQLNVGPMGDGSFPDQAVKRLQEIGAWMLINREAIHGAGPVDLPEPKWGRITRGASRSNGGFRLYLHIYRWPKDGQLVIQGLRYTPSSAFVLETKEPLDGAQLADGWQVKLPAIAPDERVSVVALDFQDDVQI